MTSDRRHAGDPWTTSPLTRDCVPDHPSSEVDLNDRRPKCPPSLTMTPDIRTNLFLRRAGPHDRYPTNRVPRAANAVATKKRIEFAYQRRPTSSAPISVATEDLTSHGSLVAAVGLHVRPRGRLTGLTQQSTGNVLADTVDVRYRWSG